MDIKHMSPYIRVALDSRIKPPWTLKERVLFDYELMYIESGEVLVTIDHIEYHGMPSDVFLFKPKQPHSIKLIGEQPLHQPHIHFDLFYKEDSEEVKLSFRPLEKILYSEMKYFRDDVTSGPDLHIPNHIKLQEPILVKNMFYDIIREEASKEPYHQLNSKGLFMQLWHHILKEVYMQNNPNITSNMHTLLDVKKYIEMHVTEVLSLDDLAEYGHLSKYHLIRLFKDTFGISPMTYHQELRIQKAKYLIQYSSMQITEISDMLGFKSIHSFSRCFKNKDGLNPSHYRQ